MDIAVLIIAAVCLNRLLVVNTSVELCVVDTWCWQQCFYSISLLVQLPVCSSLLLTKPLHVVMSVNRQSIIFLILVSPGLPVPTQASTFPSISRMSTWQDRKWFPGFPWVKLYPLSSPVTVVSRVYQMFVFLSNRPWAVEGSTLPVSWDTWRWWHMSYVLCIVTELSKFLVAVSILVVR